MASIDEIRKARLGKIELLKKAGMDPYPSKVPRDMCLKDAKASFAEFEASARALSLVGRIMAIRGQGAILFVVLDDGKDRLQAVFKKDELSADLFKLFGEAADIGDFISVTGTLFKTQRGEQSVLAKSWTMASKSLLPLPEKWHGLEDEEERLRKRYLDMVMRPELRDLFVKKAKFWDVTRNFLKDNGFLEVETPTIEVTTGGAEARPFKTRHNDYGIDVFMRISVGELWQKRLMAAGFNKTFEIGRIYRNEGSSPEHLQEFTNMEFYWAYANYEDGMRLVQDLYRAIAKSVFGTTRFATRGQEFDLADEWKKIDYADEVRRVTGIDVLTADEKEMAAKLRELGVPYEGATRERLTDTLWKHCRKKISGPAFLVNHPKLVSALAKESRAKPGTVERFQVLLAGSEVGNGYSELNDPIDQGARFGEQQRLIDRGDEEAMMPDYEFVEMLEHAMPPVCGFGFGERLFAFLADRPLRETQTFPLVKPKAENPESAEKRERKAGAKKAGVIGKIRSALKRAKKKE
ncbi:MAG TPA: lysine--tRNA ligase [Candidatus Paceibacterota bacterium]|nr:lysine--tRNA ligase [Candidatus Paceibacterota bacterium]